MHIFACLYRFLENKIFRIPQPVWTKLNFQKRVSSKNVKAFQKKRGINGSLMAIFVPCALFPPTHQEMQETFPQIWSVLCKESSKSSLESKQEIEYNPALKKEAKVRESQTPIQEF